MLYSEDESTAGERLNQTAVTQPALFAVEYALAQLWLSWGVTPSAYFGHSIGEYVAACLAGVFTLVDALRLAALRGKLIQSTEPGAMVAIRISEPDLAPLLTSDLDFAAVNGPQQCVMSGPTIKIDEFEKSLIERGIVSKRLPVSHAFHSALLDPVLDEFRNAVASIPRQSPATQFISCVTGTWITADQAIDPAYWAEHIRRTVRCADGIRTLAVDDTALLEVGAGKTLTNLARSVSDVVVPSLPHGDDDRSILDGVRTALDAGCNCELAATSCGRTPAANRAANLSVRTSTILDRAPCIGVRRKAAASRAFEHSHSPAIPRQAR